MSARPIQDIVPYLRLLETGELNFNRSNSEAFEQALRFQWAERTRRSKVIALTERGTQMLRQYLDNLWPDWREYLEELKQNDLPVSFEGIKQLEYSRRSEVSLPRRAHHKTIKANLGLHSKAGLGQRQGLLLENTVLTTDQVLRFRASRDLVLRQSGAEVCCNGIMDVLGEIILPERAFLDGLEVAGVLPKAILTVENLGSYIDLPKVAPSVMVIHVPGNDTPLAIRFLNLFTRNIEHFHFGDLDSNGIAIAEYLRKQAPQITRLFIPPFWVEELDLLTGEKPWGGIESDFLDEPLIRRLRNEGKWLEQERIALDPRLGECLREKLSQFIKEK